MDAQRWSCWRARETRVLVWIACLAILVRNSEGIRSTGARSQHSASTTAKDQYNTEQLNSYQIRGNAEAIHQNVHRNPLSHQHRSHRQQFEDADHVNGDTVRPDSSHINQRIQVSSVQHHPDIRRRFSDRNEVLRRVSHVFGSSHVAEKRNVDGRRLLEDKANIGRWNYPRKTPTSKGAALGLHDVTGLRATRTRRSLKEYRTKRGMSNPMRQMLELNDIDTELGVQTTPLRSGSSVSSGRRTTMDSMRREFERALDERSRDFQPIADESTTKHIASEDIKLSRGPITSFERRATYQGLRGPIGQISLGVYHHPMRSRGSLTSLYGRQDGRLRGLDKPRIGSWMIHDLQPIRSLDGPVKGESIKRHGPPPPGFHAIRG